MGTNGVGTNNVAPLRVFISYRREDAIAMAGRIRDHLSSAFGSANVFFDIDTIPFGVDFRQHIDKMVAECDVVLVLIGRRYLDVTIPRFPGRFGCGVGDAPQRLGLSGVFIPRASRPGL